ncbi:hypothetical protein D1641_04380 [Colidextribacter sp. OB.20]|nr:hypothetical protein [Colidextribacter sp. OB.20]
MVMKFLQMTGRVGTLFLLVCVILSDFGIIPPNGTEFSRVILHLSVIVLVIGQILDIRRSKKK